MADQANQDTQSGINSGAEGVIFDTATPSSPVTAQDDVTDPAIWESPVAVGSKPGGALTPEQARASYIAELRERTNAPYRWQGPLMVAGLIFSLIFPAVVSSVTESAAQSNIGSFFAGLGVGIGAIMLPSLLMIVGATSRSVPFLVMQAVGIVIALSTPLWISYSDAWHSVGGTGMWIVLTVLFSIVVLVVSMLSGGDKKLAVADALTREYKDRGIDLDFEYEHLKNRNKHVKED